MLAVWFDLSEAGARPNDSIANSLGLFAGSPANFHRTELSAYALLEGPRARTRRTWRPAKSASGLRVLFNGYLDNRAELAARLGVDNALGADGVYAAALDRWGDEADREAIGVYCAVAVDETRRTVRLARSPYEAPPLHFHLGDGQIIAASVPRALFAAGVPKVLDRHRQVHNLLYHHCDDERGWYQGMLEVPTATVVLCSADGSRARRYYSPAEHAQNATARRDAPEQARALLAEAAGKVVESIRAPGLLLSGGLDSPLAALALLEALPAKTRLDTFTFVPCAAWDGIVDRGMMGNEQSLVEMLAAQYPRLRPHFFPNEGINFDHRWNELFAAAGVAPSGLPNFYMYHAPWQAALRAGCDGIVCADFGNYSYSVNAPWACADYFRRGRFHQLAASLRARSNDPRSILRRAASLALLPQLPHNARRLVKRLVGTPRSTLLKSYSALNPALVDHPQACADDGSPLDPFGGSAPRSHAEFAVEWLADGMGNASDIHQGFEQLYGIRRRDVTVYRPLIEFCLSLPTEEFELDGTDRRLARRMGHGRLPEAIRANRRYGRHGVDWHARMSGQRTDLLAEFARMKANAEASALLDLDRAIAALEDWPAHTDHDPTVAGPRAGIVTRALLTARFINFVEGRNDV